MKKKNKNLFGKMINEGITSEIRKKAFRLISSSEQGNMEKTDNVSTCKKKRLQIAERYEIKSIR